MTKSSANRRIVPKPLPKNVKVGPPALSNRWSEENDVFTIFIVIVVGFFIGGLILTGHDDGCLK